MLELLSVLEQELREIEVWGLTSHLALSLRRQDDWQIPAHVWMTASPDRFEVNYKIPPEDQPWNGASAAGRTDNAEDAARMVLIAMARSGAWPEIGPPEKLPLPAKSF